MAEEIDESGFYREDSSTVSDWEVFNAQLGEVFQNWSLADTDWGGDLKPGELFTCEWDIQTEVLELLKAEVTISYHKAKLATAESDALLESSTTPPLYRDLISLRNSFGPPALPGNGNGNGNNSDLHTLTRLYGLRRFVVIHPRQLHQQFLSNPAEFSFFLSAATVVAAENCSAVPIFVQIYDPKWNFYIGVGITPPLRTNFDLVALKQSPMESRYLAGLLKIFKEKLPVTYDKPATVSVRTTYALDTVHLRASMSVPFTKSLSNTGEETCESTPLSVSKFIALPFGYFPDSYTDVYLIYTWPEINENIAFDTPMRTDFVPSKAPYGAMHQVASATSYLSSCLRDYLQIAKAEDSLESFVGRNFSGIASATETANPLQQLTEPHRLPFRTQKATAGIMRPLKKLSGPMNEHELDEMLSYLLPAFHANAEKYAYAKENDKAEFDPHRIKSAASDSLVSRLSCLLATCNAHYGGKSGLAQLWAAFTRELRFAWDICLAVPGVAVGFPDTRTCLLQQKLQMLSTCIKRCQLRDYGVKKDVLPTPLPPRSQSASPSPSPSAKGADIDKHSSQTDNVVDADVADAIAETGAGGDADADEEEFYECDEYAPEGRAEPLGDMQLLDGVDALYVPVTQESMPKTEDQLQQDAEAMLKLGPGSGLTTGMMCTTLRSDMEAFKAANPKGKMEDFIRWYSPKDWEEYTDDAGNVTGKLSVRMLAPGNTWQTVWQQAQPVPITRQKRLFDETNEALKVLYYLETRSIGEIYELTLVPLLHAAILKFKDILATAEVLDLFNAQIEALLADLCRLSRDVEIIGQTETGVIQQTPNPEPLIAQLEQLETQFYQYKCLVELADSADNDLTDVKRQFQQLLEHNNTCDIIGAKETSLHQKFKHALQDNLLSKDYVIRVDDETVGMGKGQAGPQFLRAIVTGEEIRLCGAFTENTAFI